jgi:hypothetical protein
MKRLIAAATLVLTSLAWAAPAVAKDFVQDQAGMFSAGTVAALNQKISAFNTGTGKEILVMTVPSLPAGTTVQSAAQAAFSQQSVNGILIYIAKGDRKDIIVPGVNEARAGWFTADVTRGIRMQMESQFKTESYDAGITSAVDGILAIYRQHVSQRGGTNAAAAGSGSSFSMPSFQGVHISMFWWIIIAIVGFFIVRSIIRAMSGPRYYPGGGAPMGGGMPMGGYGGGMYGGGGGGFFSGLLGGLGGAWLGNELFGGNRGGGDITGGAGNAGNDPSGGGWGNDAGQAGMSGSSGGDWGGGGFGDSGGGGGFDSGGGGFDSGGGGGDSGGGW